jgi:hypothetical protein
VVLVGHGGGGTTLLPGGGGGGVELGVGAIGGGGGVGICCPNRRDKRRKREHSCNWPGPISPQVLGLYLYGRWGGSFLSLALLLHH